ncbi:ExeM/NucH family extracellular endonuclease [Xanthomonadaceae bacterium JHOS43]|nr:ExeM/NucH family extracellular endonuclease [Xanthomonadaceae bacterium JHOS43]
MRNTTRALGLALLFVAVTGCGLPEVLGDGESAPAALPIGRIQGAETVSPYLGESVDIQGVVTGNFVAGMDGFFMQDAVGEDDGDPTTSDGIFVTWPRGSLPKVRRGDRVRVSGEVTEIERGGGSQTAVKAAAVNVLGRGAAPVTDIEAPPVSVEDWESYEGMWLRIKVPLTVTGNDGLLRFGELATSFGSRQFSPTERHPPGQAADARHQDNQRRRLVLDDNRDGEYPGTLWFLPEPLSAQTPLRAGSVVHGAEGILQHMMGWRLQLTEPLERIEQAPRPAVPELPEGIRVASFNLFNWFNGDGQGRGFPTARGAANVTEMNRQRDKLVAAIVALKPDVAALMEVENDGYGRSSSLAQLVAALNTQWPDAGYRLVDAGKGPGEDVMRVAMIHRENRVTPLGEPRVLVDGVFSSRHRVPLIQAFRVAGGDAVFNVVANHFKSKGCTEAAGADLDQRDGQSCWNATRTQAARELDAWLKTAPTGEPGKGTLILGDLNSHAQEDPLRALHEAGWRDAFAEAGVKQPYSYNFRGYSARLDHALLSAGLLPHLRAAAEWHINSDESEAFDYQRQHRDASWYAPDPYRSSDHDPLVVVLDFGTR